MVAADSLPFEQALGARPSPEAGSAARTCHAIVDQSARHVLTELTDRVRAVHPAALVLPARSGALFWRDSHP